MATVRPFVGLRFTDAAGELPRLVAPPYDVISPTQREEFAAQSPYNTVWLTLPEQEEGDRSKFVKYARSASRLENWRREGQIAAEASPSFYRYIQTFEIPGLAEPLVRTKLLALIKTEDYESQVVLPHERTFPKHKEDRLRLLEATRSHLESIFGLYDDPTGDLHAAVAEAPAADLADFVTEEDGVRHQFHRIDDPAVVARLTEAFADRKVWIADGHHRYETAHGFRKALGEKPGLVAEDFLVMGLCSMSDPGLIILPTHRILKRMDLTPDALKARLAEHFELKTVPNDHLMKEIEVHAQSTGGRAFGIALPGGQGIMAQVRDLDALVAQIAGEETDTLKRLDVSILHQFIFEKLMGYTGHDFFTYTRLEREAIDAVEGGAPAAFLMLPPTVDDMKAVALNGEFMPQKSTYYYPKLLSGMVFWSLKDFQS